MTAITFDTLAFSNRLQKAGVPREQAEAMADASSTAFRDMASDQLATKQDLEVLRRELVEARHGFEIGLANTKHEILRWMVMAMITQTALLVGIIAFLK